MGYIMKRRVLASLVLLMGYTLTAAGSDLISKAPADAKVYFIGLSDNQTVPKKFKVHFGLTGMGVAPAGTNREKTGHHHLLIDTDIATVGMNGPLPSTDKIKHFGGGQTETEVELAPGEHTLQLLLGNYVHIPHDKPVVSEKITVAVK